MFRCKVVFLCGCASSINIRFRGGKCSFLNFPSDQTCDEHLFVSGEKLVEARGRPHRMRIRPVGTRDNNEKLILCDCDHSQYLFDAWRIRNYGSGPDKYVCRQCVASFDGCHYKSQE